MYPTSKNFYFILKLQSHNHSKNIESLVWVRHCFGHLNKTQKFLSSKTEVGKAYTLHLAVKDWVAFPLILNSLSQGRFIAWNHKPPGASWDSLPL